MLILKKGGFILSDLFPDKIWNFKNFNMVAELDVAGEFIYDGIHTLNQMNDVGEESSVFSFLYHTAVGIERLQKIVIVLFEDIDLEKHKEFEERLKTHSHTKLNEQINKIIETKMLPRELALLQMLTVFYDSARYDRFNLDSDYSKVQEIFTDFITQQIEADKIQYHLFTNKILVSSHIKEIIGRIIGSIAKKYYKLVRNACKKTNTYTYELRFGSKSEKIFRSTYAKNSLQKQKIMEKIAFKELIVCLRNSKEKHPILNYIDSIEPLDFDIALFNDYISEVSNGSIPQSLVDEVESLYEDIDSYKDRIEQIDIIGNLDIDFDQYPVHQCFLLMKELLEGNGDYLNFVTTFPEMFEMIDEEYGCDVLDDVPNLCKKVINKEISSLDFIREIEIYFGKLKKLYNY